MKPHLVIIMLLPSLAFTEAAQENSAPVAGGAGEGVIASSRLIADSPLEQIEQMRLRLAINAMERGPFGLNQDPSKQAPTRLLLKRKRTQKIITPFADVVKAVPVAVVFPAEQEFLVGSRTIRTGDTFPLVVRDEKISVRVESVRSNGVVFKNLKSGERATKRLDLRPEGVTAGGMIQSIEGVIPAGEASKEPLHVDISSLPPAEPTRSP